MRSLKIWSVRSLIHPQLCRKRTRAHASQRRSSSRLLDRSVQTPLCNPYPWVWSQVPPVQHLMSEVSAVYSHFHACAVTLSNFDDPYMLNIDNPSLWIITILMYVQASLRSNLILTWISCSSHRFSTCSACRQRNLRKKRESRSTSQNLTLTLMTHSMTMMRIKMISQGVNILVQNLLCSKRIIQQSWLIWNCWTFLNSAESCKLLTRMTAMRTIKKKSC